MTSYYIVSTVYTGPNKNQYIDADTIEICTEPARGNMDGEPVIDGWAGTTNDWAVYSRGPFNSLEEARTAVRERYSGTRTADPDGVPFEPGVSDRTVIETHKPGTYAPMGLQESVSWAWEAFKSDITAASTDADIEKVMADLQADAHSDGFSLADLTDEMHEYRDRLRSAVDAP